MLDEKGFDLWADGYDRAVALSDEENAYPFAGYRKVLNGIFRIVLQARAKSVLDVGFGTGTLAAALYERGCDVYGQDFSSEMMALAAAKMPGAHLIRADFTKGLAEPLRNRRYDCILSTYALHHLTDAQKIPFLRGLLALLGENGKILIGDVAFETRVELNRCRQAAGDDWDDSECYFVAEELRRAFPGLTFTRMSPCAGILTLSQQPSA